MPWYTGTIPPNTRADGTALSTNHAADHNNIASALTSIIGGDWQALSLASGWSNFVDAVTPHPTAAYRLVGDIVQLRGLIARSPVTAGAFSVATMPTGFRPPQRFMMSPQVNNGIYRMDCWGPAAGGGGAVGEIRTISLLAQNGTADFSLLVLNGLWWSIT